MANLGKVELGDTIRFEAAITNISSVYGNVQDLRVSVVDSDNNIKINTTTQNISNFSTGYYRWNVYLDNNTFTTGSHYIIWTGYNIYGAVNYSFYEEDYFYIDQNRLV